MKDMFDSTNWIGYGAVAILLLISIAAIFWASKPGRPPQEVRLPPIQNATVPAGFVGQQPFGLWVLVCESPKPPPTQPGAAPVVVPKHLCRANARMTIRQPNGGAPLLAAAFNIVMADNQSSTGLMFRLPPAARAAASVNFFIDKNTMFEAPLRCSQKECFAQGSLPAEAIEQMRTGQKLSLVYTVKDREQKDRKVRVDQLLHGFRQAYDAMRTAMAR